jgi:hypothetical protein
MYDSKYMTREKIRIYGKKVYWKFRAARGPVVRLDSPKPERLEFPIELLSGWCIAPKGFYLRSVCLDGTHLKFSLFPRVDIALRHPAKYTIGFSAILESSVLERIQEKSVCPAVFEFASHSGDSKPLTFTMDLGVDIDLAQRLEAAKTSQTEKRNG